MDPNNENRIDLNDLNKSPKTRPLLSSIKLQSPFKKSAGPGRDHLGQFSQKGRGLKSAKNFNWARALPVVALVSLVGGYLVFKSFAATSNPYSCEKVNGQYPLLRQETSPGKGDQSKDGTAAANQCVHAVQWAFKNKASQPQVTVNGDYDAATVVAAKNFQKFFKYTPVDGNLTSQQVAGVAYLLGGFKPYVAPPVTPRATHKPAYPGQPRPGKVYWGSSKQSNGDVSTLEAESGVPLGVHRTFWNLGNVDSGVSMARADLAAGRLPFISFAVDASQWSSIGSGSQDSLIDSILTKLEALSGPVFVVFQHEPEDNGGTPVEHINMNKRVRSRMTALNTKEIALTQVLMGVDYTASAKYPAAEWYADNVYDVLGIDVYYTNLNSWASSATTPIAQRSNVITARKFAASKGKDLVLGEFGLVSNTGSEGAALAQGLFNDSVATPPAGQSRIVGVSYFNSVTGTFGYTIEPTSSLYAMIYKTLPVNANAINWMDEKEGAEL